MINVTYIRQAHASKMKKMIIVRSNNKTGGSDGLVGELLKYGGVGMMNLLHQLFKVVWYKETIPKQWREGLIVNLFKKGDKADPGNYRSITLWAKFFVK